MELNDKIVIYRTADGQTSIDVKLEDETVWLSANQMANLFDRDEKTIRKHINNVFSEGELEKENNTHFLRVDGVKQPVAFYSLDVIISVGYRVKSQRGIQFRIWANKVLKEYLVKGYVVNKVLTEQRYTELKQLVTVLGRTVKTQEALTSEDALNLVEVVSDYAYALDTLDRYDYQQLAVEQTTNDVKFHATYEGAMQAIEELKEKFGGSQWFAHEKDDSFKSSSGKYTRLLAGKIFTLLWRKKRLCCFISSRKIIRLVMATNVLLPPFFCGLWPVTVFSTIRMGVSALPITPLWLLR